MIPEIDVQALKARLTAGEELVLLDVRERDELDNGTLPGIVHIPAGDLGYRVEELDPERETIVICRTGNRSGSATRFLLEEGFRDAKNMAGGMNAWAREIGDGIVEY